MALYNEQNCAMIDVMQQYYAIKLFNKLCKFNNSMQ